ncbi:hypothetical protein USDA257_c33700 [Sinorhizobium fredii USDA 257]|uniref:Uncharacterized protein n=2 Tax=Sinorhizobium/Ensifer group TaxID=227292 RepID=I3X7S7_SINF2|nr:hypothetical protein USDA257_c33700 [Sinorhizobium fredii USDA 257]
MRCFCRIPLQSGAGLLRKNAGCASGRHSSFLLGLDLRYSGGMKSPIALRVLALSLAAVAMVAESVAASPPDRRCTCRNRDGAKYELGQVACIRVDGIAYLARCEMNLNVTTWKKVRDGCPTAHLTTTGAAID